MKRFKKILFVADLYNDNSPALERAVALAENNQAELTIINVIDATPVFSNLPEFMPTSDILQKNQEQENLDKLKSLAKSYQKNVTITAKVATGIPFLEIIQEVINQGHDLVIKNANQTLWLDRFFSSDDMHLLRKCPCPVWLVNPKAKKSFKRIMAAVDVNDSYPNDEIKTRHSLNKDILELSCSLAFSEFSELHIAYAWEAIGESIMKGAFQKVPDDQLKSYIDDVKQHNSKLLDNLIKEVFDNLGKETVDYLKPQTHMIKGWPRKEIPELASKLEIDLIIMGTVGRTGIPGFVMGNTAETILNQINCSVLAIKPQGFVSPVE